MSGMPRAMAAGIHGTQAGIVKRSPMPARKAAMKRGKPLRARSKTRSVPVDDGWPEAREAAMRRAGGLCQMRTPACVGWAHAAVHVHHRLPRSAGGKHDAENLVCCCEAAHSHAHGNPEQAYAEGWLISRYG